MSEPRTTQPPMTISSSVVRRGTGPRTRQGKDRSKRNALKHGIFSDVVVLATESRAKYDSLRDRVYDNFEPVGALEEALVEKLTVLLWRFRRLYGAEAAEIRARSEFIEWDERQIQTAEAGGILQLEDTAGLLRKIANAEVLQTCLDLLDELEGNISRNGLDLEQDRPILTRLCGDIESKRGENHLFKKYLDWHGLANVVDHVREEMGLPSPEECQQGFLEELDAEMTRLQRYEQEQASIASSRMKIEAQRQNVPDTLKLDRLLKYETGLERAFDRTLIQLERAQRMRLGQPVAPRINVNVSS